MRREKVYPPLEQSRAIIRKDHKAMELKPVNIDLYKKSSAEKDQLKSIKKEMKKKVVRDKDQRNVLIKRLINSRPPKWGSITVKLLK